MAGDLQSNLDAYNIQLEQVEAALLAEPNNDSLLKLKADLIEIINITNELLQPASDDDDDVDDDVGHGGQAITSNELVIQSDTNDDVLDAQFLATLDAVQEKKLEKKWKVGDKCMAVWSKNNQYFEAVIDGISEGKAAITFTNYNVTEINQLGQLKTRDEVPTAKKYGWERGEGRSNKNKSQWQVEKERRKQKALKRIQRLKQLEEDKEKEKFKWKEFNKRALAKAFKGVKKDSIFATTEQNTSRVGVGNSGRPMTRFVRQDRHSAAGPSKLNYSSF